LRKKKFVLKAPDMSEARIRELAERIKPVMEFREEGRCYIKPVDIFAESFTWDPEPAIKAPGLKPFCDITTYHSRLAEIREALVNEKSEQFSGSALARG